MKTTFKLNAGLANVIIALHSQGFDKDFSLTQGTVLCAQNNESYELNELTMIKVKMDNYTGLKVDKMIYTIETLCGNKGLLLLEH